MYIYIFFWILFSLQVLMATLVTYAVYSCYPLAAI